MKKVIKLFIISLLAFASVLGLIACGGADGKTSEKGIICTKLSGDGFYTVIGYGAEQDESGNDITTLDIAAAAQAKYGDDNTVIVVGRIRAGAFDGNTSLTEIILKDNTEGGTLTIDAGAFKNMRALKKITLPFIGANRFSDADYNASEPAYGDGLKATDKERLFGYIFGEEENDAAAKVTQSYGDTESQTATFYIPATLTQVTLNANNATCVPMYAFCNLPQIATVTLQGNINAIGRKAFNGMAHLKKVNIPASVKTVYDSAFENATNLKIFGDDGFKIDSDSLLEEIKNSAFKGTRLTEFDLSGTQVKVIGDYAFYGSALKTIDFSATLETIGAYAFANSKDLSIIEPSCTIGVNAFAGANLWA